MLVLLVIVLQALTNSLIDAELKPPQISSEVMFEKLSKTGMFEKKVSEFLKILSNISLSVQEQRESATAYISNLKNAKVKEATQNLYDEIQHVQNFTWSALDKTNEVLAPLLGPAMAQVQQVIDQTCRELKGNLSSCLPQAMRNIALQMVPVVGKNKTLHYLQVAITLLAVAEPKRAVTATLLQMLTD
ncbi:unnamed protein product [Heligmosomoides polygyrus]|uniref:DUF148 domain-containing protein n=1 Tax=Heligmosomoides polygyrus TaxID=6339 RepID=A0A3P8AWX6_HELPZ|nr:unnamed protein product [Heligmosomoides polygyrus]